MKSQLVNMMTECTKRNRNRANRHLRTLCDQNLRLQLLYTVLSDTLSNETKNAIELTQSELAKPIVVFILHIVSTTSIVIILILGYGFQLDLYCPTITSELA